MTVLVAGVALTAAGMAWLAQVGPGSAYLTVVALPMTLIGAGQGLAFAPMTSLGMVDVPAADAGAASGLVNTAHQLGMATGLAILVALSAGATNLATQVSIALTGATCLLLLSLAVVLAVIVPAQRRLARAAQL